MEQFYIGAQLYINKNDTQESVRRWVRLMHDNSLKVIRLFMIWDQLEPEKGRWVFDNYDACFDEAKKLDMLVVPTLMAVSPPGWMLLTKGPQDVMDIDDPAYWHGLAMEYVSRIVKRYSLSPVLHSWILWNEPARRISAGKYSIPAFREFLREKYGNDIDKLNKKYFSQFQCFEDVLKETDGNTILLPFCSFIEKSEWTHFTVANLCRKLKDICDEIRKTDVIHPVHVNPAGIAENNMDAGQSIWKEADIVDYLGCSAHPPWHSTRFPRNRLHQSIAYFADLARSATPHKEKQFWVTEMQGGPTTYSSPGYSCPTAKDIEHWLWESIGSGAGAVIFWCFNSRDGGIEGGEWSLLNQAGRPSPRLRMAKSVADLIQKNRDLFDNTKPGTGKVTLLFSENSWMLGDIRGTGFEVSDPRNRQMGADALCGAYLMFSDAGLGVNFIDETRLKEGSWMKDSKVLVLPGVTDIGNDCSDVIRQFCLNGGIVIADGLCGINDEEGSLSEYNNMIFRDVFGMEVEETEGAPEEFEIRSSNDGKCFSGWFVRVIPGVLKGKCVAWFDDGREAAVVNRLGDGMGIRIGTAFFQRYLSKPDDGHLEFLKQLLPENLYDADIRLENPSSHLRLKRLSYPEGEVIILLNRGEKANALITASCKGSLESVNGDFSRNFCCKDSVRIPMCAEEVKVFKWTPNK